MKSEVAPILATLVEAIQNTGTETRMLITCRYEFASDLLKRFFLQGLEPLKKAELTKKLNRLEQFRTGQLPDPVRDRALAIADGNPRLLEFLNDDVLGRADTENLLTDLEQSPERWKKRIIWEELYQLIDAPLQRVLGHCLVYELPVPMAALDSVCHTLPDCQQQVQRGRELGQLEVSAEAQAEKQVYRVSRLWTHILPDIRLPEAPAVYALYQTAHEALHPFWGHRENESAEQWRELFRLKFANQDNPERFRQGFSQMLAVQYNAAADRGFEVELRSWKAELSDENLCDPLEVWLSQEDWRRADEETAWLFYVVMVRQGFEDWAELFKSFPTDILNKIDRVWVTYSQEHFGFSVQKCIWEGVGGKENANHITIREFGKQVGWYVSNNWRSYNTLSFSPESQQGNLPALPHTQPKDSIRLLNRWGNVMPLTKWVDLGGSPFDFAGYFNDSLLSRQDLTYNKWAFQTSCQA